MVTMVKYESWRMLKTGYFNKEKAQAKSLQKQKN